MKLGEARQITSQRLNILYQQKRALSDLLQDEASSPAAGGSFDRVEISKELTALEEEYDRTQALSEELSALDANIQNAEIARQQSEVMAEAAEELMKILEVFRRISKGDRVPPSDEQKLLEYNAEMYMAAKNMALMAQNSEGKEHKSLWEEEGPEEEPVDPAELAANTEVGNPLAQAATPAPEAPAGQPE